MPCLVVVVVELAAPLLSPLLPPEEEEGCCSREASRPVSIISSMIELIDGRSQEREASRVVIVVLCLNPTLATHTYRHT